MATYVRRHGKTAIGEVKHMDKQKIVGVMVKTGKPFCWQWEKVVVVRKPC